MGCMEMSTTVYTGASATPDTGQLKGTKSEWNNIQNVRGWGNFISKRRGIQTGVTSAYGTLGIFDLKNDGDPLSQNKILVVNTNGDFVLYDYSELVVVFDFLFSQNVPLGLQSQNGTWFSMAPNNAGQLVVTVISAPINTISSNLIVLNYQFFGFQMASNVYRVRVDSIQQALTTQSYSQTGGTVVYQTIQAFNYGFGVIFQDQALNNWMLSIQNSGSLTLTIV